MTLLRFRIDLPGGQSVGPGKIELLERLAQQGSISAAARAMKVSYRQAWLLLESLNHAFDRPVFETSTGGRRGGGARVTPFGRTIIVRYRRLERELESITRRRLGTLARPAGRSRAASSSHKRLPRHARS